MTKVVVCCDGLDPDYLKHVDTPGWETIAADGQSGICPCAVPSLTNVNNVGIVTGEDPMAHGVSGNTYYDSNKEKFIYMKSSSFLKCKTIFQQLSERGDDVGALVVKEKLENLISQGCSVTANAENPPQWLENAVGTAPDIYSGDASSWLLEAATSVVQTHDLDWLYVSTTDVVPHKHAPQKKSAIEWVKSIDSHLSNLYESADEIVVTADHGMSKKKLCVDVEAYLDRESREAIVVPLIRDAHTYHHQNLGGAAYVYLEEDVDNTRIAEDLRKIKGIDLALPATKASSRFNLPADRIGDVMLLGTEEAVFGTVDDGIHADVNLRSHGSHHEKRVPYASTVDEALSANFGVFKMLR